MYEKQNKQYAFDVFPERHISFLLFTKMQISRTSSSTKSDHHLCYLLSMKYNSLSCYVPKFNILASRCSSAGWIEPYLVENLRDRFSPEEFHISFTRIITL